MLDGAFFAAILQKIHDSSNANQFTTKHIYFDLNQAVCTVLY